MTIDATLNRTFDLKELLIYIAHPGSLIRNMPPVVGHEQMAVDCACVKVSNIAITLAYERNRKLKIVRTVVSTSTPAKHTYSGPAASHMSYHSA